MSEKRFTIDKVFKEYPKLRDNETECFYHLVDNERNAEIFCERLNNLVEENERLKNKLNVTALELVDEAISMGKAVEISEMSYREFIDYRAENGKPMELQL